MSVITTSFTFRFIYYVQECGEYILLLTMLSWTMYYTLLILYDTNKKNITLLILFSILSMYSQYGAVFPVASILIIIFIYIFVRKKDYIKYITCSYFIALIIAALPLYFLFLRKQMVNQKNAKSDFGGITFVENIFNDIHYNLREVLRWNFLPNVHKNTANIILFLLIICIIFTMLLGKNKKIKLLTIINIVIWILYYIAVKFEIYAYTNYSGGFANRYNLFFIPIWIVWLFSIIYEISVIVYSKNFISQEILQQVILGCLSGIVLAYVMMNWEDNLKNNWKKEDNRGVVEEWYMEDGENIPTIIYTATNSGFSFYVRNHINYDSETENNVYYLNSKQKIYDQIVNIFDNNLPDKMFFVISHGKISDEIHQYLLDNGYSYKENYNKHQARLIEYNKNL